MFLVKIKFFPMYANIFCDAGQVPILRYFEACKSIEASGLSFSLYLHLCFVSVSRAHAQTCQSLHYLTVPVSFIF